MEHSGDITRQCAAELVAAILVPFTSGTMSRLESVLPMFSSHCERRIADFEPVVIVGGRKDFDELWEVIVEIMLLHMWFSAV